MSEHRSQHFEVKLAPTMALDICLRRFITAKSRRSKKFRQLVIQTGGIEIKEVALRLKHIKAPERTSRPGLLISQAVPLALIIVGLIGLAIFGQQAIRTRQIEPVSTFKSTIRPIKYNNLILRLARSTPVNLSIPSLNITANVIPVGQTVTGAIDMPPLSAVDTVGWYKYSPTPGQLGPSVIAGHVDNYQTTSIFWRLHLIKPDAIIAIKLADGITATFKVTRLAEVSQANFPTNKVYGNISYPGLRLITCGGSYNAQIGSYTENTVVYATLVS